MSDRKGFPLFLWERYDTSQYISLAIFWIWSLLQALFLFVGEVLAV